VKTSTGAISTTENADLQLVDELSAAYIRILEANWALPVTSRQALEYPILEADRDSKTVKRLGWPGLLAWPLRLPFLLILGWWRSFVLRPVVSVYVNTHINKSASKLSGTLTRERLSRETAGESATSTRSLDSSIATLERLKSVTTSWAVLLVLLKFVPVLGLIFSMGIVTVSFTLNDAPELMGQLIALVPGVVLLIHPAAVQFGFRWKRALFAGGGVGDSVAEYGLPHSNTYAIEQQVYHRLKLKRSTEFPVDLFLAPGIYFLFNWVAGLIIGTWTVDEELGTVTEKIANAVAAGIFATFLALAITRLYLRYHHRRDVGMH
jgi:hypothetical protein